jgi:hypothetical protein
MKRFSVWYRYNGRTCEMHFLAESFEQARERVIVFKASTEDEPRIHCNGDAEPEPALDHEVKPATVAVEAEHA